MSEKKPLPLTTPEKSGIGSTAILNFLEELEQQQVCLHSFLVIKDGQLVSEGYFKPFTPEKQHRLYSCSKSFTSVAIGFLESEGKIHLDDPIINYFPDKLPQEGVHPFIARTTIRDMLRMATPHAKTTYKQYDTDDWLKTFFICPPSHLPGTVFSYDTSASYTLAALVERLSGVSLMEYLRPRVFDKIGISSDAYCLTCPRGISHGGSGIIMAPRDFAKFALTCMQEGMYQGEQVIPRDYIRAATTKQIDNRIAGSRMDSIQGYGYQFWMMRNGGFSLLGMGGQLALCMPKEKLLVVTTADVQSQPDGEQLIINAMWRNLYPAACCTTPLDAAQEAKDAPRLAQKLQSLQIAPVEGDWTLSSLAKELSGKTFHMQPNPMALKTVRFDFEDHQGTMTYENAEGTHTLRFGFGEHAAQKFPGNGYDSLTSAAWVWENTLLIRSYIIDECFATLKISVTFEKDAVTVVMHKFAELFLEEYEGFASGYLA